MTYLEFHLVFVLPPLLALAWSTRRAWTRLRLGLLGLLCVVAVGYTYPWDVRLIELGVWGYPEGRVLATLGPVPVEEVAFFVLMTLFAGLWTFHLVGPRPVPPMALGSPDARLLGAGLGLAVTGIGVAALQVPSGTYLGMMMAWVGPVLAVQWGYGGPGLLRMRRLWLLGIGVPALYLCLADRVAIGLGIWHFDPALLTGWTVFGLQFEEGMFFFVTTSLVVQGLLLGLARFETSSAATAARTTAPPVLATGT